MIIQFYTLVILIIICGHSLARNIKFINQSDAKRKHKFTSHLRKYFYGYTLYSLTPKSMADIQYLQKLKMSPSLDVILFEPLPKNPKLNFSQANKIPFLASHKLSIRNEPQKDLVLLAAKQKIDVKVVEPLVSNILYSQVMNDTFKKQDKTKYEHFHSQATIYQWIYEMALRHPKATQISSIGLTAKMREIFVFTLKLNVDPLCPSVVMEAGSHGNEWLSTAFVLFFMEKLLTSKIGPLQLLKERYCWHFIPILNPDGYVYSQQQDFLWRKNRNITDELYHAVDLDRNFNYKFGVFDADCNIYNDRWPGPAPFSEVETQGLKRYLERLGSQLMFYFSIQGYGQKFIIPFSDSENHEKNYDEVANLAKHAARKIFRKTGQKYHVGTAWETLGVKWSGDSASWVKRRFNAPFVMTLRLRDDGTYGPALPKEQILDACNETTIGLIEMLTVHPYKLVGGIFDISKKESAFGIDNLLFLIFVTVFWIYEIIL